MTGLLKASGRVSIIVGSVLGSGILASACFGSSSPPGATTPAQLLDAGVRALSASNYAAAQTDFNKILTTDPKNVQGENKIAFYDLGVIAQTRGDNVAAGADYQQAINLDSNYYPAEYNLATIETMTEPLAAVNLYKRVIAVDPSDVNAIYNLGLLLYGIKSIPEGQMYLSQAIRMNPSLAKKLPPGVTP